MLVRVKAGTNSLCCYWTENASFVPSYRVFLLCSMDMSNMLKPALARGDLQLLGATTLDEFRIIEKDSALTRRLQTVYVNEPNVQDTISILRGLRTPYELHHGLRIHDEALVAAAHLSDRYMTDRKQPDKSIDLVDEACSRLRLEQESKPDVIWEKEQALLTKQIELSALENEDNKTRTEACRKEVNELQEQVEELTEKWQKEKSEIDKVQTTKEELEKAKADLDAARRRGDFAKAGELLHSTIPDLEAKLMDYESHVDVKKGGMLSDAVTETEIANIVSRHTGIPVNKIMGSDESERLLSMENTLRRRVVGQDHALVAIADCVRLARTRLQAHDRTLGNFLFLGPTGVGSKYGDCLDSRTDSLMFLTTFDFQETETAKALADFIFDDQDAMTRIDLSEYGEKHTVSRLIGAPPGYIGYDEAGVLTESVRRRPYQILLLDEFEKAHKDVWNLFLQLFDEGHLTDSHGRKVDFRNTSKWTQNVLELLFCCATGKENALTFRLSVVVIMTSNLGASVFSEMPEKYRGSEPEIQNAVLDIVRQNLSPELLNRIDETVVFNRLQREHMDAIAQIGLAEVSDRLLEGQNMKLEVSDNAQDVIAEMGYDIRYGARPLKRVLAKELLNPLSRLVLEGAVQTDDHVQVRTRAEAERLQKRKQDVASHGWLSSNPNSDNPNDIVVLRNHDKEGSAANNDNDNSKDPPKLVSA